MITSNFIFKHKKTIHGAILYKTRELDIKIREESVCQMKFCEKIYPSIEWTECKFHNYYLTAFIIIVTYNVFLKLLWE